MASNVLSRNNEQLEHNLVWIAVPVSLGFWIVNGVLTGWRLWVNAEFIRAFFTLPDWLPDWAVFAIGITSSVVVALMTYSMLFAYLRFIARSFILKSSDGAADS